MCLCYQFSEFLHELLNIETTCLNLGIKVSVLNFTLLLILIILGLFSIPPLSTSDFIHIFIHIQAECVKIPKDSTYNAWKHWWSFEQSDILPVKIVSVCKSWRWWAIWVNEIPLDIKNLMLHNLDATFWNFSSSP